MIDSRRPSCADVFPRCFLVILVDSFRAVTKALGALARVDGALYGFWKSQGRGAMAMAARKGGEVKKTK